MAGAVRVVLRGLSIVGLLAMVSSAFAHPSYLGPTGGLNTPNPLTLAPERTEVALHLEGVQEYSPSKLAVETVFDLSPKVLVGVYDYLELGVEQTLRMNSGYRNEAVTINAKYRFPFDSFNVAVGALITTNSIDWTSVYSVLGWKVLYGGFGVNFGGRSFRELTQDQFINVGVAKMGGYQLRREVRNGTDVFTGEPDSFFGFVGLDYKVAEHLEFLADYNGDRFAAGVRVPFHSWGLDVAYVSQRANDTLFNRTTQHWRIGFLSHW